MAVQWHTGSGDCTYARRTLRDVDAGLSHCIYAHRIVINRMFGRALLVSEQADHINRDKRDNRRENLRIVTRSGNQINRESISHGKGVASRSGLWGAYRLRNKWICLVRYGGEKRHYSSHETPQEAARKYDEVRASLGLPPKNTNLLA